MKKLIILVGLLLITNSIFADGEKATIVNENTKIETFAFNLTPIVPKVATFEILDFNLIPIVPKVATFEDKLDTNKIDLIPVVPTEATFED